MRIDVYILHCNNYYLFDVYEWIVENDKTQSKYVLSEWYLDVNENDESKPISANQHVIRFLEELLCCSCFKDKQIYVTVVNTNGNDLCSIPSKPGYYSTSMISLAQYRELDLHKQMDVTQLLIRSDFKNTSFNPTRLRLSARSELHKCELFHEKDMIWCHNVIEIKGNGESFMSICFFNVLKMIGRIDLDASMDYYIHLYSTERNSQQIVTMKLYNSRFSLVATLRYEEGASFLTCDTLPVFHKEHSYRSTSPITLLDPICSIPAEQTEITIQQVQGDNYQSVTINDQGEIRAIQSFNSSTMTGMVMKRISIRERPFLLRVDLPQHDGLLTLRPKNTPSICFVGKVTSWKNGCATGRLFINSVLLFEGSLKHWKMEGQGTKYYMNGKKEFEGSFVKNVPHGKCRQFSYSDRETSPLMYEGDFVNGLKDGEGKLRNTNGDVVYSGKWKKDRINEEGVLTLQDIQGDCEYYVGEAVDQIVQMKSGMEESVPMSNLKGRQIRCKKLISGMVVEMEYIREYVLGDEYKEEVVTPVPERNRIGVVPVPMSVSTEISKQHRTGSDSSSLPPTGKSNLSPFSVVAKSPSTFHMLSNP